MNRKIMLFISMLVFGVLVWHPVAASAAASFNQNQIIDDATFDDANRMNSSQIDAFLNGFPNSCISPNSGFMAIDPTGYNPTDGYSYGGYVTAGKVIYDASQTYGINPQVLLATLQKEQSLVIGGTNYCSNGDENKYAAAVGYGCPDGGTRYSYTGLSLYQRNGTVVSAVGPTCVNTGSKAGFSQQVIRAAWLFKFGEQRAEGRVNWAVVKGNWNNSDDPQTCYGGPMTQGTLQRCPSGGSAYYDGYTTIDGTAVHMDNGATAALYWYTPHFSGNTSFYNIFTGWFGDTISDVYPWQVATAAGGDGKYYLIVGNTKRWISDGQIYQDWGLNNYPVQQVSASYLNNIPTIPDLGRLGVLKNGQYVFVDNGQKFVFNDAAALADWGYNGSLALAAPLNNVLSSLPTAASTNQFVQITGSTTKYLMASGTIYPINPAYDSSWQDSSPTVLSTDAASLFVQGATLDYRISAGGRNYVVDNGQALDVTSSALQIAYGAIASNFVAVNTSVMPYLNPQAASLVVRASNSAAWQLLINGQQHYVPSLDILRDWAVGQSQPQVISPQLLARFTVGSNLGVTVHTSAGNYYFLDGTKHLVSPSLVNAWVGSSASMELSESQIIPDLGSPLNTPLFQVDYTPNIYTMVNGQYQYIQTGGILNGLGYPAKYQIATIHGIGLTGLGYGGAFGQFTTANGTTYYLQDGVAYPINPSYTSSWTLGSAVPAYSGSDFTARFTPSATPITPLIVDSSNRRWLVDGGSLINISTYADAYEFTNYTTLDVKNVPQQGNGATYLARSRTNPNDSRVWLINRGHKQWIVNGAEYNGYGGNNVPITWLSDTTLAALPNAGEPLPIIGTGTSGLKFLVNGQFDGFADGDTVVNTIGSTGYNPVSNSIFNSLSSQSSTLTRVFRDLGSGKIYFLINGQKHWLSSGQAYSHYASTPVTNLPAAAAAWFTEGVSIDN